jgi:predicted HicB family RNase H-like nuclease
VSSKKDLTFDLDALVTPQSTAKNLVERVADDYRRLVVDVSPTVHAKLKARAAKNRLSINAYVLNSIEKHCANVTPSRVFPRMRAQSRIIIRVPAKAAEELLQKSTKQGFEHFNDFVLSCLEKDGIQIK